MKLTRDIELETRRCFDCGRWWGSEPARAGTCPICAKAQIERIFEEQSKLERTIASLKGVVTKLKKRI